LVISLVDRNKTAPLFLIATFHFLVSKVCEKLDSSTTIEHHCAISRAKANE